MLNEWMSRQTDCSFSVTHQLVCFCFIKINANFWHLIKIQTDLISPEYKWIYSVRGMIQMISVLFWFWMLLFFFKCFKHFHSNVSFLLCQHWNLWPSCFVLRITSTSKTTSTKKISVHRVRETAKIILFPLTFKYQDISFVCTQKLLI